MCALRMAPALPASRRVDCRAGPVDWDTALQKCAAMRGGGGPPGAPGRYPLDLPGRGGITQISPGSGGECRGLIAARPGQVGCIVLIMFLVMLRLCFLIKCILCMMCTCVHPPSDCVVGYSYLC